MPPVVWLWGMGGVEVADGKVSGGVVRLLILSRKMLVLSVASLLKSCRRRYRCYGRGWGGVAERLFRPHSSSARLGEVTRVQGSLRRFFNKHAPDL